MTHPAHPNMPGKHEHDNAHDPMGHHITSLGMLLTVLLVLLGFTFFTVYTAMNWRLGILGNASLALGIATIKATFVCMYFMHLKHDNTLFTVIGMTCLAALACFLFFTLSDLGTRDFVMPYRAQLLTPVPGDMVAKSRYTENQLAGRTLFLANCAACHGADGQGARKLVGDFKLVESKFLRTANEVQLVEFVKAGRTAADPANISGYAMPPKGGNPALTDEQILQIVDFAHALAVEPTHHDGGHGAEEHGAESHPATSAHEADGHAAPPAEPADAGHAPH